MPWAKPAENDLFNHVGNFCCSDTKMKKSAPTTSENDGAPGREKPTKKYVGFTAAPPLPGCRHSSSLVLKLLLFLTLGIVFGAPGTRAQELMRESLAGTDAGQTVGGSNTSEDNNYNLQLGPVRFYADAFAGFEYVDNITYSQYNRESDEVVRIGVNIRAMYAITRLNTLQLDLGIGFVHYIEHPNATDNDLFITPGSQVAFNIYVADIFRINFHDSFALLQDPVDQPDLSNTTDFGRFTNTVGVTLVADFNTLVLTVGYDHFNYISLNSDYDFLNRSSESFLYSAVYKLAPRTFIGVEGNTAITAYDQDVQNGSTGGSIGGYFDMTFNTYVRLIIRGGYQYASFDNNYEEFNQFDGNGANFAPGTRFDDKGSLSDFYYNVTLNHRINAYVTESLSGGRENDLGLTSNYLTENYVRYSIDWRALSKLSVGGSAFYENDQESGGLFDEHLQRFGVTGNLNYQFSLKLSASVYYAYLRKDSDVGGRSYYQNTVGVNVDYRF